MLCTCTLTKSLTLTGGTSLDGTGCHISSPLLAACSLSQARVRWRRERPGHLELLTEKCGKYFLSDERLPTASSESLSHPPPFFQLRERERNPVINSCPPPPPPVSRVAKVGFFSLPPSRQNYPPTFRWQRRQRSFFQANGPPPHTHTHECSLPPLPLFKQST